MKKRFLHSFLLLWILTACISENVDDREAIFEDEEVDLTILVFQSDVSLQYKGINEYVSLYTSNYPEVNIDVEVVHLNHNDFKERSNQILHLDDYIAAYSPDIVELSPFHLYVYQDQLVDLTEYFLMENVDQNDFYPALLEALSREGRTLAVPLYYDINLMTYNASAFEEAGLPYPTDGWTIEEVIGLHPDLNVGVYLQAPYLEQLIMSYGAYVVSPLDYSADGYLNSSETKEAIQLLLDQLMILDEEGRGNRSSSPDIETTSLSWINMIPPHDQDIMFAGVPFFQEGERVNTVTVSGLGILNDSTQKEEAWHFIRQSLIENNEVSQLVAQDSQMSTRKSVSASSGYDQTPLGRVVINELTYAQPSLIRLNYFYGMLIDREYTKFNRLLEEESIDSILNQMVISWDEELSSLLEKR